MVPMKRWFFGALFLFSISSCGDDDDGNFSQALQQGVGDACGSDGDCVESAPECLTNFKGGYCGISDCESDLDCPSGSACIAHDDGTNYCFLICRDKIDCNYFRPADSESNCSSNVDFVDGRNGAKACVPPS